MPNRIIWRFQKHIGAPMALNRKSRMRALTQGAIKGVGNARKEFLEMLASGDEPTIVFGVQGGVFAEGVDYPGDMLIGALIVGPALPSFDLEREILREYYEKNYGSGFDYAYTYPAMAKVVQSAGRVIRSPTDKGLVVLLDQRFVQESYVKTMPIDWHRGSIRNLLSQSLLSDIAAFWSNESSP